MPNLDPATLRAVLAWAVEHIKLGEHYRNDFGKGLAQAGENIRQLCEQAMAESRPDPGDYRQCPTCSGWVLRTEPHSCGVGPEMPEPGLGQCQSCGEREGHGDWCPVLEERERLIAVVENLAHEYDSPESEDALRDVLAALKAAQTQEPA